ncbi:MAG: VCBS repeat-containing protein [Thermodesulfobacteriota bacterium]
MKIAAAHVTMTTSHSWRQELVREESSRAPSDDDRPALADQAPATDRVSLSSLPAVAPPPDRPTPASGSTSGGLPVEDPRLLTLRLVLEAMTGRRFDDRTFSPAAAEAVNVPDPGSVPAASLPAGLGWGLEYDLHAGYRESERMTFAAAGTVLTEDGTRHSVAVELLANRQFEVSLNFRIRAGDALLVDPLAVNFTGGPARLTEEKFAFDLDGDGTSERISFLTPESGFLFLDRDGDGRVGDGRELFGPTSGSGFAELADLDGDGSGWLDDNDPMFAKLQLWIKDAAGNDSFPSLREKNIGAILLDHLRTPFALNGEDNGRRGRIAGTGLYLGEDGASGTVQEIDLAV